MTFIAIYGKYAPSRDKKEKLKAQTQKICTIIKCSSWTPHTDRKGKVATRTRRSCDNDDIIFIIKCVKLIPLVKINHWWIFHFWCWLGGSFLLLAFKSLSFEFTFLSHPALFNFKLTRHKWVVKGNVGTEAALSYGVSRYNSVCSVIAKNKLHIWIEDYYLDTFSFSKNTSSS